MNNVLLFLAHIKNLVEHILIKRCFFLLPEALIFTLMQKRDKKIKAAFYLHPSSSQNLPSKE